MKALWFETTPDLVGRRNVARWSLALEDEETLADLPEVTLLRKERDFEFPAIVDPAQSPYVVYDTSSFPTADTTVNELPAEEWRQDGFRYLRTVTTLSRETQGIATESLRLTELTQYDSSDRPVQRDVEVLDLGDTIGGLVPGTPYYYELQIPEELLAASSVFQDTATPGELHGMAAQLYDLLPAVHRRHDTVLRQPTPGAEAIPEASPRGGQLRRMLDPFGTALDQMRSSADDLRGLHNVDQVRHHYLPLLAKWIGWELSHDVPIPLKRHEVKFAPALYRQTGTIPSAHLWVQHTTGWQTRVKEYTHNVFQSNQPEGLNVWHRTEQEGNSWSEATEPVVLQPAPSGKPSAVHLQVEDELHLFLHAHRMNQWGIWGKSQATDQPWRDSQLLSDLAKPAKDPSAVVDNDGTVWLFWNEYDSIETSWSIHYRTRSADGEWGAIEAFGDGSASQRYPSSVVAEDGTVWLFWLEADGRRMRLRYSAFSGGSWSAPIEFPADPSGEVVYLAQPVSVVSFPTAAPGRQLWVFSSRREPTGQPGQSRSVIELRTKDNLNVDASGWSGPTVLSSLPPVHHEEAPAAVVSPDGELQLFTSSNRDLGWSLWRRDFDAATNLWSPPQALPTSLYSEREVAAVFVNSELHLFFRSNRCPLMQSDHPRGIASLDFRYSGSTTLDVAHPHKISQVEGYDDFQAYTYDVGQSGVRGDDNRYAHDTAGVFLDANTASQTELSNGRGQVRQVLPHFIPSQLRAVLSTDSSLHVDAVYDYLSPSDHARRIGSSFEDFFSPAADVLNLEGSPAFEDSLE